MGGGESTGWTQGSAKSAHNRPKQDRALAPLGVVTALSSALTIAAVLVIAAVLHELLSVTALPPPLLDTHQHAETLTYVLAFAVILPLGIAAGPRICDRIAAGANGDSLSALVALLSAALGLGVIAVRIATEIRTGSGPEALAGAGIVWLLLAALALGRAASPVPRPELAAIAGRTEPAWATAALVLLATTVTFCHLSSISWPLIFLGAVVIAVALLARERIGLPKVGGRLGGLLDLVLILLLVAAVPNIVIFTTGGAATALENSIIQFHQDFYLGPANQVMAGHPMLVDTLSQYGVGSIDFLAGLFELIPIGNRSLGLIEGLLSAGMFVGAYAALRIARVSRLLTATTLAVAVIVTVYGLQYPLGGLLQHGAFRFGLPIGIVVGAVAEARWPGRATAARGLQLLTLAIASIWAFEALAYTVLTLAAVVAFDVLTAVRGDRRRRLIAWVMWAAAAFVIAHLIFALATLATAGELPDWGWYINTLREFLVGEIGDLTYDFSSFSPGLAVGAFYLVSATGLVLLLRRRPEIIARERPTLVGIAAMTAYGIGLYSYIVDRSADHIIPYVCLPAFALVALWLGLIGRPALGVRRRARAVALGLALAVGVLLVAVAASSVPTRFSQSLLGVARPGGSSLSATLDRIWDPPPLGPEAADGEQLLSQYMPGADESIVLTSADPSIEILTRSERGNAVPLGDPWEDSFVPDEHLDRLGAFVDGLKPGDRMLIDEPAHEAFDRFQKHPGLDPLAAPTSQGTLVPSGLATLQLWTLAEIGRDYDLKTIATSPSGVEVVELVPAGGTGPTLTEPAKGAAG